MVLSSRELASLVGVVRLINAAHAQQLPAIVGGRAFGTDPRRALAPGADAWAASAHDAVPILAAWRASRPVVDQKPQLLNHASDRLFASTDDLAAEAMQALAGSIPAMSAYDENQKARTREDLVFIVQFLGAAVAAADDMVFQKFSGVSTPALVAGLEALTPGGGMIDPGAQRILDSGRRLTSRPTFAR